MNTPIVQIGRKSLWLCAFTIGLPCLVLGVVWHSGAVQAANQPRAATYYVAPGGDDGNPGTLDRPWQSIQHAAESIAPGDPVYVRGGVYNEAVSIEVSGSAEGGYITFRNYPGETPVLDGTGLSDPNGVNGIYIDNKSFLIISGIEIRNYTSALRDSVPIGIQIEGASQYIQILNNYIHHIETTAPVDGALLGSDAHGLVVYGSDASQPVRHLTIAHNEMAHLKLGSSEAVALNGNVEFFTVTHNVVHNVDNIGMAFIGFEETVADPRLDRARHGIVTNNLVYFVDSFYNPAYGGGDAGGGDRSADGIYVDGGRDIVIERNRVYAANIGIEVASEHAVGNATNVTVRNNWIYRSHVAGIAIGGYDSERGYTANCTIVNNTLFRNDTTHSGSGELMMQYDTRDNLIMNNIFYANDQNVFISNAYIQNRGNIVDSNLYYAAGGAQAGEWLWKNVDYTGFDVYRTASGNDSRSLFVDPLFVDVIAPDLHLRSNSPAINAGDNTAASGDYDVDGEARIRGIAVDIGADERPNLVGVPQVYLPLVGNGHPQ